MPRSRQALPIVATSWIVPMTFDAWFITTAFVLGFISPMIFAVST